MNIELTTWQYCSIINFARFCITDTKLTFSFISEHWICYNLCRAKKNIIEKRKYVIYEYFCFIHCYNNYKVCIWSRYLYINKFKLNFLSLIFHKESTFLFIHINKIIERSKDEFYGFIVQYIFCHLLVFILY